MIHTLWNTAFFEPLYNGLMFLISVIPGGDVGLAVIALTILVRIILYPIAKKSIESQIKMRAIQADLDRIKEQYTDKQEQSRRTFELYKEKKVNPFSGCLLVIVQLPIIIALYRVFLGALTPDASLLYSFVHIPDAVNTNFLGFVDIHQKNIIIALLAGISQYFQISLSMPKTEKKEENTDGSFQKQLAKSMQFQMRYFLPVFVTIIAYQVSGAVALYWLTSNLCTIAQEVVIRKRLEKKTGREEVKAEVIA